MKDKSRSWDGMIAEISRYMEKKYDVEAITEVHPELYQGTAYTLEALMKLAEDLWKHGTHFLIFRREGSMGHCVALVNGGVPDKEERGGGERPLQAHAGLLRRLQARTYPKGAGGDEGRSASGGRSRIPEDGGGRPGGHRER